MLVEVDLMECTKFQLSQKKHQKSSKAKKSVKARRLKLPTLLNFKVNGVFFIKDYTD